MSDARAAFLQAICENPDDDTPRLVFADWLDENDDPDRAEFIRLQVGLAAGTVPEARRAETEVRVRELFGLHRAAWTEELPRGPGVTWMGTESPFPRGFVDTALFRSGKTWREHAADVFASAPVSYLRCGGAFTVRTVLPVLASPLLGRLTDFSTPVLDPAGAETLANNPHFVGRLRSFSVGSYSGDETGVAALSRASGLRNLETVSFGRIGPVGVAALAGSLYLTRLKDLCLHSSPVGDDGLEALANSPTLSALEALRLNYAGVGDRGVRALAQSKHLNSLRILYLGSNTAITDAGALALAATPGLPQLVELHLWGTNIGEPGARALAAFAEGRGLSEFNLRHCPLPADLVQELRQRLGPRFLR